MEDAIKKQLLGVGPLYGLLNHESHGTWKSIRKVRKAKS